MFSSAPRAQEWREQSFLLGRVGHDVAFDSTRGAFVLLGGRTIRGAGESGLWEWNGTRADRRDAPPALTEREDHALCFDGIRQEVLVFGGVGLAIRTFLDDTWTWNGRWATRLTTPVRPPARVGHRMVWQAAHSQAVLFGGVGTGANNYLADTWVWRGSAWQQLTTPVAPSARALFGMAYDPRAARVLLFGGADQNTRALGDTWEFDGTAWRQSPALGPTPRHGLAMEFDPALDAVVLFGGGDIVPNTDLWSWDRVTSSWVQRSPASAAGRRYRSCMASGSGTLLLFGGTDNMNGVPSTPMDVWSWNGSAWSPAWAEQHPLHRSRAVVGHDPTRGRTVLYGGWGPATLPTATTWEWDGEVWYARATGPGHRVAAQGTWDSARNMLLLFGGASSGSGSGIRSDLWGWDGNTWRLLDAGVGIPPRDEGAMAFDSRRGRAVLFGGSSAAWPGYASGTLEWTGTAWVNMPGAEPSERIDHAMAFDARRGKVVLFGGLHLVNPSTVHGDTWEWDGTVWTQMSPPVSPPPRRGHSMVFDSTLGRVLLFGGDQFAMPTNRNDCWAYDGVTWTQVVPPGTAPRPRAFHACAFDPARDRMVVLGGLTSGVFTPDFDQWDLLMFESRLRAPVTTQIGRNAKFQLRGVPQSLFLLALSEHTAPGIPFLANAVGGMRHVPLSNDRLFRISLGFGLAGAVGTSGMGSATLAVPPDPLLAGLRVYSAGVLWEPTAGWQISEEERTLLTR